MKRRNIRVAFYYAYRMSEMTSALYHAMIKSRNEDIDFLLSLPFVGYIILSSVDIISSGGRQDTLANITNDQLQNGKAIVAEIGHYWINARTQVKQIDKRQIELSALGIDGSQDIDQHRLSKALETAWLPNHLDILYGVPTGIVVPSGQHRFTWVAKYYYSEPVQLPWDQYRPSTKLCCLITIVAELPATRILLPNPFGNNAYGALLSHCL